MFSNDQNALLRKLQTGDKDSYNLFYQLYGKKIYNLAFKMTGSHSDAEDITQNTLLQIYLHVENFRKESSLSTWIYSITKNLCLKHLQKAKRSSFQYLDNLIHDIQITESCESYSDFEKSYYIDQVKEGCLLGLLRCLSFYQRMSFLLVALLELDVKQVAQILEKSESAIRTLVFRARQNLKTFLCKNCSLYHSDNVCRCENLIHFSLKQGWIQKVSDRDIDPLSLNPARRVEQEIRSVNKLIHLYRTLSDKQPSSDIIQKIQSLIENQSCEIFSNKKVK